MHNNQSVVAIIPARKGSSGCPGKNFRLIAGKPLVMWSVEAALQSDGVDIVVISTNDENVIEIVKSHPEYGESVLVVERPDSLSGPTAKTEWAMVHALDQLKKNYKLIFDITVLLQPTSPLRLKGSIDKVIEMSCSFDRKSALSVSLHTPFFLKLNDTQRTICLFDAKNRKMRQDLCLNEFMYHDDGCIYACNTSYLQENECRIDENPALFINDSLCSFQIDTEQDFRIMEIIMKENMIQDKYYI